MDNQKDYTVAFAIVGLAEALADMLRAAGKLEIPSQARRQTRRGERLCTHCGKQGHKANDCTTPVIKARDPVASATAPILPVGITSAEAARIAKITVPGSRYKPKALGVADVKAIERCRCGGETHRLALMNDGKVAVLDHPRRLFRLQGWALKSAGQKLDGCWAKLAWLQENAKRTYGDHGMVSKAVGAARKRDEKRARVRNPVEHERGKNYEAACRAAELAQHKDTVTRWREEAIAPLRGLVDRFGTPSISHRAGADHPTLIKRTAYSGRTKSLYLNVNVIRWYATVHKKGFASVIKNGLILEVLDTDVLGRPSRVTALRKGKTGVECVLAVVKYGPTGAGRFCAGARDLTVKQGGY